MKILLIFFSLFFTPIYSLETFFNYTNEEITSLERKQKDPEKVDYKKLIKSDRLVEAYFQKFPDYISETRLFTYLYIAYFDAEALSKKNKRSLKWSVEHITHEVLSHFHPEISTKPLAPSSEYSQTLAQLIGKKIANRMQEERSLTKQYRIPKSMQKIYTVGLQTAKWKPWIIQDPQKYWPPHPPQNEDSQWEDETNTIHEEINLLDEEKTEAIYFWAGLSGPLTGDWRVICNDYLFTHALDLKKILQIRATIMAGIYDAAIASFSAKYTYLVQRPSKRDPSIQPVIDVPAHPSYPSNHSYSSGTAAFILSHYFPKERPFFDFLAEEAGQSRIWAGIHYPLDHNEGIVAGELLASALLKKIPEL